MSEKETITLTPINTSGYEFDASPGPPYTERDLIELACRAPACPEWFRPDMSGVKNPKGPIPFDVLGYREAESKQRIIQWPKAYARMVLEAK
jgi:hypothetical protein